LMQEVEALCSNIYILSKWKIVASGSETEIMKNTGTSSIEAAFLKATGTYSEEICE
jgi:ABC-type Na+ transport system ATPase subunit NatA